MSSDMTDRAGAQGLYIVAIGGASRPGSSTERALRLALDVAEAAGAETDLFTGPDIDLPVYAPERADRGPAAQRLVAAMRRADGFLIGSPAYHGGLSGLVKNAIDYAEDLKEDARPYFDGRAVGCIATAAGWQGIAATLWSMRSIVYALRGWATPLGVGVHTAQRVFGDEGECLSPGLQAQLELVGGQVLDFARWRRAGGG
jgi:FMN reductase